MGSLVIFYFLTCDIIGPLCRCYWCLDWDWPVSGPHVTNVWVMARPMSPVASCLASTPSLTCHLDWTMWPRYLLGPVVSIFHCWNLTIIIWVSICFNDKLLSTQYKVMPWWWWNWNKFAFDKARMFYLCILSRL